MRLRLVKESDKAPIKQLDAFRLVKHFAIEYMSTDIARHAHTLIDFLGYDMPFVWDWAPRHSTFFTDEADVSIEAFDATVSTHHRPVSEWLLSHGAYHNDLVMLD